MREMEYKRKVDKKRIPTCNIMGVNIAAINMEWLLDYLEKNISEIKGDYICVSNVHTTVSSLTTSSKSVMSLRPLTCHIPVIPGLIAIRAL